MKKYVLSLILLITAYQFTLAQDAEPAVTGFTFNPNPAGIGIVLGSTFEIAFLNNGFTGSILPGDISIQIGFPNSYGPIGATAVAVANNVKNTTGPTNPINMSFTWTYNTGLRTLTGVNNTTFAPGDGGNIYIKVEGLQSTGGAQDLTTVNLNILANFPNYSNDPNNDFGDAGLAIDATLPVELTSFKGNAKGCDVSLSWSTVSEVNNAHFEVEHSISGKNFTTLKKIEGAGTTLEPQTYSFLHEAGTSVNYYRLKQVDFDGSFEYSNTIIVETPCRRNLATVEVFPNLTHSEAVQIQIQSLELGDIQLDIADAQGRRILSRKGTITSGILTESIDVHNLAPGTYYIYVTGQGWSSDVKSFVKINK